MTYYYDAKNFDTKSEEEQAQILKDIFAGIAKPDKSFTFQNCTEIHEYQHPPALYRTSRFRRP